MRLMFPPLHNVYQSIKKRIIKRTVGGFLQMKDVKQKELMVGMNIGQEVTYLDQ